MNQTIKRIVDILFQDTVENEETDALHEELMNNCQEHYEDLVAHGMSEDEAIGAVVESLKGMKDVIDEYPKKENTQGNAREEKQTDGQPESDIAVYETDGLKTLRFELTSNEVTVVTAPSDRIIIECDEPEKITTERTGSVLKTKSIVPELRFSENGESFFTAPKSNDTFESYFSGILSKVRNSLKKVADTIGTDITQPPVRVTVPENFTGELAIMSKSGEISVTGGRYGSLNLHSVSGEIRAELPADHSADHIDINTTSGSITAAANARRIQCGSISGDMTLDGVYGPVQLKTVSGDIKFRGDAGEMTTNTVSGDAKLLFNSRLIRSVCSNSVSGDLYVSLPRDAASVHTDINTRSGDRYCRFGDAGPNAELKITANSVSGDIRID